MGSIPLCSVLGHTHKGWVHIIDELILPDSNTLSACEEFLARTSPWCSGGPIKVEVYGDATGAAHKTSASRTDWQIVREFFGRYRDRYDATLHVPSSNPPVKDRINCVNAKLKNHAGDRRLLINPKCKQLIKDLEQVSWKADPHGNTLAELDRSDPMRTHVSDALGYFIAREFGMHVVAGERGGPPIC
jgi:hypothetical protein